MALEYIQNFQQTSILEITANPTVISGSALIHPDAQLILNNAQTIPVTPTAGTGEIVVNSTNHGVSKGDLLSLYVSPSNEYVHSARVDRVIDADNFVVKTSTDISAATDAWVRISWVNTSIVLHGGTGFTNNADIDVTYTPVALPAKTIFQGAVDGIGKIGFGGAVITIESFLPNTVLGDVSIIGSTSGRLVYEIQTIVHYNK